MCKATEQKLSPVPAQGLWALSMCHLSQLLLLCAYPLLITLCPREMLCSSLSETKSSRFHGCSGKNKTSHISISTIYTQTHSAVFLTHPYFNVLPSFFPFFSFPNDISEFQSYMLGSHHASFQLCPTLRQLSPR